MDTTNVHDRSTYSSLSNIPLRVWYSIGLLTTINIANSIDRTALSVLAPEVKGALGLSDSQLGLLIGPAFALFYAFCGVPIGRWADSGNRRNIISIALAVWSAATALSGLAQHFWHLFLARVGIGAGEAGGLAPAQSILCDLVPLKLRGTVFSIHGSGLVAGSMLGLILAGWLGDTVGWREAFFILGAPGLLLALIVRLSLREPQRGIMDQTPRQVTSKPSYTNALLQLWSTKTYRILLTYLALNGFVNYALLQWLPTYLVREFVVSLTTVGLYFGFAIGIGAAGGLLAGGILAQFFGQRSPARPLFIAAPLVVLAFCLSAAAIFAPDFNSSIAFLCAAFFLWSLPTGLVIAGMYSVVRADLRATAGTLSTLFTSLLGMALGPLLVGAASDFLAEHYDITSLRYALALPLVFAPLMPIQLWRASRSLPNDLDRLAAAD